MQQAQCRKNEFTFKHALFNAGYSAKAATELWKWYDDSNKKGVASF